MDEKVAAPEAEAPEVPKHKKVDKSGGYRGGRPPGTMLKKTRLRLAAEVIANAPVDASRPEKAPSKATDGISPKDLLLQSMRECWVAAYSLWRQASKMEAEVLTMPQGMEQDATRKKGSEMRMAAEGFANRARELAAQVAPYEHPRLASQTATLVGGLTIQVKKFSGEPEQPRTKGGKFDVKVTPKVAQ